MCACACAVPQDLRIRLREYFFNTKHLRAVGKAQEMMCLMSDTLRAEVAFMTNERWLNGVAFLTNAPKAFLVQLSLTFSAKVYAPNEICRPGVLYIIERGLALYEGQLLGIGRVSRGTAPPAPCTQAPTNTTSSA